MDEDFSPLRIQLEAQGLINSQPTEKESAIAQLAEVARLLNLPSLKGQPVDIDTPILPPLPSAEEPVRLINLKEMSPVEQREVLDELAVFLDWLLREYEISDSVFPYACWYRHPYITEEVAAIFTMWRYHFYEQPSETGANYFLRELEQWRHRIESSEAARCCSGQHYPPSKLSAIKIGSPIRDRPTE